MQQILFVLSGLMFLLSGCASTSSLPGDIDQRIHEAVDQAVELEFRSYLNDPGFKGEIYRNALSKSELSKHRLAQDNLENLVTFSLRIASDIQAWKMRESRFGGGASEKGFKGITLEQLGYRLDESKRFLTSSGYCSMEVGGSENNVAILCYNRTLDQQVVLSVTGLGLENLHFGVGPYEEDLTFDLLLNP